MLDDTIRDTVGALVSSMQHSCLSDNRMFTVTLHNGQTLFEVWFYQKPSIHHLRVFGCQSFRLLRKETRDSKVSPVTSEGVHVGFD